MVETIIKRKIIKKKKKPKKSKPKAKPKPTQEQKQTQIVNIYNSGKLRNPIGIKRQKQKDKINPLELRRVYRPISINQHVNSFEVEQRLYRKIADENRLNQIAQKQERENQLRTMQQNEIEKARNQQQVQLDLANRLKNLERKLNESQRTQLEQPINNSFEQEPSMGFGDKNLDDSSKTEEKTEETKYDPREFLYTRKEFESFSDEQLRTMLTTPPFEASDRDIDAFVESDGSIPNRRKLIDYLVKQKVRIGKEISSNLEF